VGKSGFELFDFGGVVRIGEALREGGEFGAGKAAGAGEFKGKMDDLRLFGWRKLFDLFNNSGRSHGQNVAKIVKKAR
jgi:hypothetical protein